MNAYYLARTAEANSVWIDVSGAGQIRDVDSHTIIYASSRNRAFRFSKDAGPLTIVGDDVCTAKGAIHKCHAQEI